MPGGANNQLASYVEHNTQKTYVDSEGDCIGKTQV